MSEVMRAIDSIAAERRRQVEAEGWTPEHDDAHDKCELARAAACYALAPSPLGIEREWVYPGSPKGWPWSGTWWKPGFYRRNLVKAGALIVAEIERWDRLNGVVREHPVQGRDDHAAALASTTPETPSANLTEGAS